MDSSHIINEFFAFFCIMMRIKGFFIIAPLFSQSEIPVKIRSMIAVTFSFCLLPAIDEYIKIDLHSLPFLKIFFCSIQEFLVGFFLGSVAKALFSIIDMAGSVIGFQLNLSNALLFNPAQSSQGSLTSLFLTMAGGVMFLSFNLHHLLLKGLVLSYQLFPLNEILPYASFAEGFSMSISTLLRIGLQLSSPFIIIGLTLQLFLGFLNRLMPQIHIFFIALPLQISVGLIILLLTIGAITTAFVKIFDQEYRQFFSLP